MTLMVASLLCMAAWAPAVRSADTVEPATGAYRDTVRFRPTSPFGMQPIGPLLLAPDGHLYGTSTDGGANNRGVIFRFSPTLGSYAVVYSFSDSNLVNANTGLTLGKDGALYGLTGGGGLYNGGTAYKVTLTGTFSLLHSFGGASTDGTSPHLGSLALGADGNFYGTTRGGGYWAQGTAFRMTPTGQVKVLHQFEGGANDGATPTGQLTLASDGNFYGTTTSSGPASGGVLFRMTPAGKVTTLVAFSNAAGDAHYPNAAPIQGADGFLYGTTAYGGQLGGGVVYKVALNGTRFSIVHHFDATASSAVHTDGNVPISPLMRASDGNLYGTCFSGGDRRIYGSGAGTLYKISPSGTYATVREFGRNSRDAGQPMSAPTQGPDGLLYGTTINGDLGWGALYQQALQ